MDKPMWKIAPDLAPTLHIANPMGDTTVQSVKLIEIDPAKKYLLFVDIGHWLSMSETQGIKDSIGRAIEGIGVPRKNVGVIVLHGIRAELKEAGNG